MSKKTGKILSCIAYHSFFTSSCQICHPFVIMKSANSTLFDIFENALLYLNIRFIPGSIILTQKEPEIKITKAVLIGPRFP